jgi:riboflavin synthase alpha subunit
MFTGLVARVGTVRAAARGPAGLRLRVDLGPLARRARAGDSVAVAGACLTLVARPRGKVGTFDVVPESLARTRLGALRPGDPVNLEGALRAGDPLGGHFVLGHVDGLGRVRANGAGRSGWRLSVAAPAAIRRWILPKGSVAVDGVSLTVASRDRAGFAVALVPATLAGTTLGRLRPGDRVHLEGDLLVKAVRRALP